MFLQQYEKIHAKILNFRVDFVYYFAWGTDVYNSVLSRYLISLPKSGYKTQFLFKNDTVLYHMIKYVFLQEYAKNPAKNKVEA